MLKDDEAIGEIINYIIRGDLRYDAEKGMNPNSWRMLNGKYGVLVYASKQAKQKRHLCLDEVPPVGTDKMMAGIYVNEIIEIVHDDDNISERERIMFNDRHIEKMSLRQIGKKHSLTHERVRQILENIYEKVRKHYEGESRNHFSNV